MKKRLLSFLLAALLLMLSACTTVENVALPLGTPQQTAKPSSAVADANHIDEFQTFLDTWNLSSLIAEGHTMTEKDRSDFLQYFQQFDDDTFKYVILLLQGIAAGTVTVTDDYDDHENGVYLSSCEFCLYDMNGDGAPELILKTGASEADYMFAIFTIVDGKLIECGMLGGSHAALYADGSGSFVRYEGHMGYYDITVSTLEGTTLVTKEIANGEVDFSKDEDYPEIEDYGYGDFNQYLEFTVIPELRIAPKS